MNLNLNDLPEWLYINKEGKLEVSRQILYTYLKSNLKMKISDKGNIFLYESNVYRQLSVREFKFLIKDHIPVEIRTNHDWEAVWKEFSTDNPDVNETEFDSDENLIGFENGVLDLETGKLMDYDESLLLTRSVACKYLANKTLDEAPIFKAYLDTLCTGCAEEMDFLLEYMGGILSNVQGWRFKKLLILVGEGNTGKTQIRELTMNLLGRTNCVSIDMKKINERFGAAQLYRKRLAGSGDMSTVEISEMNVIKNLTGGDSLFAEYKGKDGFSFRYDGLLWFNANELPHFRGDRGNHVYKRFSIIRCNNIIPEADRDPQLLDKMMREKDVIASVAVDKFKLAMDRGYKFSESYNMKKSIKNYQIENNSLLMFMNDCCIVNADCKGVKRSEFNALYKKWCAANRVLPERDRDIGKQLMDYFHIEAKKSYGHFYYPIEIKDEIWEEYRISEK